MGRYCYTVKDPCCRHPVTIDSGKPTRKRAFRDIRAWLAHENLKRRSDGLPECPPPRAAGALRDLLRES